MASVGFNFCKVKYLYSSLSSCLIDFSNESFENLILGYVEKQASDCRWKTGMTLMPTDSTVTSADSSFA